MSKNNEMLDNIIWTMLDIWVRMADIAKKHSDYKYIQGVGFQWDHNNDDDDFIEYCRLLEEYKSFSKIAESMDFKLLLRKYYYYR